MLLRSQPKYFITFKKDVASLAPLFLLLLVFPLLLVFLFVLFIADNETLKYGGVSLKLFR